MSHNLKDFKEIQLDLLKEVGNIGAGHAATALSTILQKPIDMNVPKVMVLPFSEIEEFLGGEDQIIVGIFLRIEGEIPGNMFFTMTVESADELLEKLLYKDSTIQDHELSEMDLSALKEIGNILAGSYLSSLADFTNLKLAPSVPAVAVDMVGAILSFGLIQISQFSDYAIVIDTAFLEDQNQIEGHFFLIPDPEAFDQLFTALGVPLV